MAATHSPARRERTPVRRGRGSADGQVLGTLLVVGGVAWLLGQTGVLELSATTLLSVLLLVLGLGLVATARSAGGGGLVVVGLALTVVLASATAVDVGLLQRGAGERSFRPTSAEALGQSFQLGAGSLTVDLRELSAAELRDQRLHVQVGLGEIVVVLPPEDVVPIDLVAEARAGEVELFDDAIGGAQGGTNVRRTHRDDLTGDADARLEVDLDVGLGSIQVVRAAAGSE